jgi:hypothetical protein
MVGARRTGTCGVISMFRVPVRHSEQVREMDSDQSNAGRTRYSGQAKFLVCRGLDEWEDLADIVDIPPVDRNKFPAGRKAQAVWEWLEERGRLGKLRGALDLMERDDLVKILDDDKAQPSTGN